MKTKKKILSIVLVIIFLAVLGISGVLVFSKGNDERINEQVVLSEKYLAELEYEKAIAAYQAVLEIEPKNMEAHKGIINVYIAQGEYQKAYEYAYKTYQEIGEDCLIYEMMMIEEESGQDFGAMDVIKNRVAVEGDSATLDSIVKMVSGIVLAEGEETYTISQIIETVDAKSFNDFFESLTDEQITGLKKAIETVGSFTHGGAQDEYLWFFYIESEYQLIVLYSEQYLEVIITSVETEETRAFTWVW